MRELVFVDDAAGTLEQRGERIGRFRRQGDELAVLVNEPQPSVEPVRPEVVIDRRPSGRICRHRAERIAVALTSASLYFEARTEQMLLLLIRLVLRNANDGDRVRPVCVVRV